MDGVAIVGTLGLIWINARQRLIFQPVIVTERRFDIIRTNGTRWLLTDSGALGEDFSSEGSAFDRALELAKSAAGRVTIYRWQGDQPEKVYDAMRGMDQL